MTWKKPQQQRSRPALEVDLQFVISTQDGELHPPKDSSRREMHVSDAIMTMWRRKILANIKLHAEMGSRLAARYWRYRWATSRWRDRWMLAARRG